LLRAFCCAHAPRRRAKAENPSSLLRRVEPTWGCRKPSPVRFHCFGLVLYNAWCNCNVSAQVQGAAAPLRTTRAALRCAAGDLRPMFAAAVEALARRSALGRGCLRTPGPT